MNVLRLIPEQGGEAIAIDQDRVFIGRDPASDIHLRDASVSRQHAEIRRNDDEWVIIDLQSGNGVLIDGARTSHGVLLPGQALQLGNVRFRVQIDRGDDGSTVILGRSPLAGGDSTMILRAPRGVRSPATPLAAERSGLVLIVAVMVGMLAVISLGLVAALYISKRQPEAPVRPPTEASLRTTRATPAPKPISETPVPAAMPAPQTAILPRGALLISTDTRAVVFVDGRRTATLEAGGLRRVEVSPGEHIVSFRAGEARHDQIVRTKANEQAVVRYSGHATAVSVPPPPPLVSPTPSPAPLAAPPVPRAYPVASAAPVVSSATPTPDAIRTPPVSPSVAPVSTPPHVVRPTSTPTPPPVLAPAVPDDGLQKGAAAAASGDFFRALLVLKDVARRLEKDPRGGKELARAHAYLAWTYHALNRPQDAEAEVAKAVRIDPGIVVLPNTFPVPIVSLFKRAR